VHARRVFRQKRLTILKAIQEETDLSGESKSSVREKFGYPLRITKKETPEGKKETWLYLPYKTGTKKIVITFLDDKVIDVIYK